MGPDNKDPNAFVLRVSLSVHGSAHLPITLFYC